MRGRPRKEIDVSRIATLRAAGLSVRAIASVLGNVSYSRVYSELKNNKKTPTSETTIPRSSGECLPNTSNTAPLAAHNTAFSLAYKGTQPVSLDKFVLNNNPYYRFEYGKDVVLAHKNRILVWINGTKGATPEETEGRARGRARAVLAEFAQDKDITLVWGDFGGVTSPHFTVEDKELNEWLLAQPEALAAHKLKEETTSHRKQVQADCATARATLEDLLNLPPAVRALAEQGIRQQNENGKQVLMLSNSVLELVKAVKGRMDTFEEREAFMEAKMLQITDALREIALDRPKQQERRMET